MPLDPVLVLVVVDHEARLVIPLLQPLHRHAAVVLGTSQSEPPLVIIVILLLPTRTLSRLPAFRPW